MHTGDALTFSAADSFVLVRTKYRRDLPPFTLYMHSPGYAILVLLVHPHPSWIVYIYFLFYKTFFSRKVKNP